MEQLSLEEEALLSWFKPKMSFSMEDSPSPNSRTYNGLFSLLIMARLTTDIVTSGGGLGQVNGLHNSKKRQRKGHHCGRGARQNAARTYDPSRFVYARTVFNSSPNTRKDHQNYALSLHVTSSLLSAMQSSVLVQ